MLKAFQIPTAILAAAKAAAVKTDDHAATPAPKKTSKTKAGAAVALVLAALSILPSNSAEAAPRVVGVPADTPACLVDGAAWWWSDYTAPAGASVMVGGTIGRLHDYKCGPDLAWHYLPAAAANRTHGRG